MSPNPKILSPPITLLHHLKSLPRSNRYILVTPPAAPSSTSDHHLSQLSQKTQHTLLRLSLPSIPSTTSGLAYPTRKDITTLQQLASRSGINSVIGVGNSAAVTTAKILSSALSSSSDRHDVILVPGSLGGVFAATNPFPFVFCPEEDALLYDKEDEEEDTGRECVVLLDDDEIEAPLSPEKGSGGGDASVAEAALASLSIAVDSCLGFRRSENSDDDIASWRAAKNGSVENAVAALDEVVSPTPDPRRATRYANRAVLDANQLLRLSSSSSGGIIPVSLSSSLLPRYFPRGHLLSFWASLLPALCSVAVEDGGAAEVGTVGFDSVWADDVSRRCGVSSLAELAEGTPSVEELLDTVDAHQILVGGGVQDEVILEEVLRRSLNR